MADDNVDYDDQHDDYLADYAVDDQDDFYSLGESTDDAWRIKDYNKNYFDDDQYYSTKHATSWLDSLLGNTTTSEQGQLTPAEDVNPDNVWATLVFNCFVCVILLGLYELLRRWIPSVYSQRLVYENQNYNKHSKEKEGCHSDVIETAIETCIDSQFAQNGQIMAPGQSLRGLRVEGSVMNGKSSEDEGEIREGEIKKEDVSVVDENSLSNACDGLQQEICEKIQESNVNIQQSIQQGEYSYTCCKKSCNFPVLEWCIPVHNTSWATLRRLAGLDAYFYLRYIRMCLKITSVSSFWAIIILCPVYATGGGNESGFYHFSMANVLQNDKGRVWVPTIFCWLFTMYCCFCVRAEMMHYVELRMEFLGGEEEERILHKRKKESKMKAGGSASSDSIQKRKGYGAPKEIHGISTTGRAGLSEGQGGVYGAPELVYGSSSTEGSGLRDKQGGGYGAPDEIHRSSTTGGLGLSEGQGRGYGAPKEIHRSNSTVGSGLRDKQEGGFGALNEIHRSSTTGGLRSSEGQGGGDGAPEEIHRSNSPGGPGLSEEQEGGYRALEANGSHATSHNIDTILSGDESESDEQRSRSRSPLLTGASNGVFPPDAESGPTRANDPFRTPTTPARQNSTTTAADVQKQLKQHRYSLQVEKVPVELRSNTALFNYFNEMFPNQVHSAHITMNVPDLDALSARRTRVCRRLEKSLAYYSVTGIRPHHIAGRPRCRCCGIESTPIDGCCIAFCCFYDSLQIKKYHDHIGYDKDQEEDLPTEKYETLPDKGECVDSILYYTLELANCNQRLKKLQQEQFQIAETGNSVALSGINGFDESNYDWYAQPLGMLKRGAARTAEGLREEFEVSGEEDYLGNEVSGDGSVSIPTSSKDGGRVRQRGPEKRARLMNEDHLSESDRYGIDVVISVSDLYPSGSESREDFGGAAARRRKYRYQRPYTWQRALLWRMGVDFLAAGLDEVRTQTDVVVDSVTRPSMSSTGFVTFKTLTPVTVTTSAPLTYNRNPMEVTIAPEPRDLVWQNVQIDQDIGASRAFVANVLLGLGVLLWSIPLTMIQAWAKVENVALIPGLEWVDKIHGGTWKPFVNGYLPVITLLGLILLLPLLFQWVATSYEKRKTLSGVQNSIVGRFFYYQLANIYITVTAGALWTSLSEIIDHPQKLLVILGGTFPKLAGYFISLLITKTLAGLPMVLLRVGALSRMMFLRSCFNKKRLTQRELKEVYRKQPIFYGWEYPTQFLVIIICFTYACITPIVLPVGATYYFVALLVYKKQALYVYTPTYESGGRMFPQAVSKTLFALLTSQLTFIGYTLIRKGVFQIILLAPLPFLTVYFTLFIQKRFVEPSKKLSLERAVKIDAQIDQSPEFSHEAYQQPVLTEKASVPVCETDDYILTEVLENLERLQNESTPDSSVDGVM